MSSNIRIEKECIFCNKKYIAKTLRTKYCSHECNRKDYKQRKREEKLNNYISLESKGAIVPNSITSKEFLSIKEVSELLGLSIRSVHRYISNGEIPSKKFGKRTIIMRTQLNKLFE